MLVLLLTFVVGNFLISPKDAVSSRMLGHDFLAFYTAGTFVRHGHFDLLYNLPAVRDTEHLLAKANGLEIGPSFGPWWNPPLYAWLFAPLSALPYGEALAIWTIANLLCLAGAIVLLMRMLPATLPRDISAEQFMTSSAPLRFTRDWRNTLLVPLLVCVSMPFVQAISHGQNTFGSLLLLCGVVVSWRARQPIAAGLICGLMFYKPQLAAVVATMLVLSMGPRVCLGLAFTGGLMVLATALTLPDTLAAFLDQLPINLHYMQIERAYLWERHVTLRAFWRLLLQGREAGEFSFAANAMSLLSCAALGAGLMLAWWRSRSPGTDDCWTGETRALQRDRLIGATITAMPLLMPFYFDYDLLLLAVPATLLARELILRPKEMPLDQITRLLIGGWMLLFVWAMVNPPLAGRSGINLTTILLGGIASLSITRACRIGVRTTNIIVPSITRVTVKRAA